MHHQLGRLPGHRFATEFLVTLVLALAALVILDGSSFAGAPGAAAIGVGFLVWGLVAGLSATRLRSSLGVQAPHGSTLACTLAAG